MKPNILMPIMIFMTRYYHNSKLTRRSASVPHDIFKVLSLTFFAIVAFFVSSCEEKPTMIGSNLLPGSDFVKITSIDTLSARSYTMYDDSVRTDNPSVSYLGQISDPYFGTTTAEFVTQIRMGSAWDDLPFIVDSVKLYLHLLSSTGGSSIKHYLKISEIADPIYTDSAYYSNKKVLTTGYEFPDIEIPVFADTVTDIVLTLPPQTLNGPMSFGNYITRDTAKLFYNSTISDFKTFFKGLYFQIEPSSDPLLISLSLAQPKTLGAYYNYFVLFMSDLAGGTKEFIFVLDATNKNAAYNRFMHNFNTASPDKKIQHINDGYRDTLSYLQYLNGVYTKVVLPGLTSLKNDPTMKNIAVNKAKLTIPVQLDGNLYKATTVPSSLILRYRSKAGIKYVVPDYNIDNTYHSFFNGTLDTVANEYNFNIPAFVQGYLEDATGQVEPELEVFQGAGTRNVILKANNSKTPVKFQFTYTKF
jgi:Domain of unknown function (DUF4270)